MHILNHWDLLRRRPPGLFQSQFSQTSNDTAAVCSELLYRAYSSYRAFFLRKEGSTGLCIYSTTDLPNKYSKSYDK
jgi:hypothetical protein